MPSFELKISIVFLGISLVMINPNVMSSTSARFISTCFPLSKSLAHAINPYDVHVNLVANFIVVDATP